MFKQNILCQSLRGERPVRSPFPTILLLSPPFREGELMGTGIDAWHGRGVVSRVFSSPDLTFTLSESWNGHRAPSSRTRRASQLFTR